MTRWCSIVIFSNSFFIQCFCHYEDVSVNSSTQNVNTAVHTCIYSGHSKYVYEHVSTPYVYLLRVYRCTNSCPLSVHMYTYFLNAHRCTYLYLLSVCMPLSTNCCLYVWPALLTPRCATHFSSSKTWTRVTCEVGSDVLLLGTWYRHDTHPPRIRFCVERA